MMRKMAICLAMALWVCPLARAEEGNPGAKVKKPALEAAPEGQEKPVPQDEATQRLLETLKTRKVTFHFEETPLSDALSFLRALLGVNILIAPEVNPDQRISLKVDGMEAGSALQWMLKLAGATMEVRDGAIYVSGVPGAEGVLPKGAKAVKKVPDAKGVRRYHQVVGKAQLSLGQTGTVELYLYDDELEPETREMLLKLLHNALAEKLEGLEKQGKAGKDKKKVEQLEREEQERKKPEKAGPKEL